MLLLAVGSCMVMTLAYFTLIAGYIDKRELELKLLNGEHTPEDSESFGCNDDDELDGTQETQC